MSGSAFGGAAAPRDDIHGYSDATEPGLDLAVVKNGSGRAAGEDDAEIQIAVRSGIAAGRRAEEVDVIGAVEADERAGDLGDGLVPGHRKPINIQSRYSHGECAAREKLRE